MLLIDAHVHIYDCFDLEKFFDSAYFNFKSTVDQLGHGNNFTGILLLAETSKENWFQRLAECTEGKDSHGVQNAGNWNFHRTDEIHSLFAKSGNSKSLLLIAGRQIVTCEDLEILALFTIESFKDGTPIKKLIEEIKDKGGIPVIPWGFGKWIGRRGTILNKIIETAKHSDFCLGDSGNRPSFMPIPSQFKLAQNKNIRNLCGSDPLPFASEVNRAGFFGSNMPGELPEVKPAEHLKVLLKKLGRTIQNYGSLERPYRFFRNQIASQLRKKTQRLKKEIYASFGYRS